MKHLFLLFAMSLLPAMGFAVVETIPGSSLTWEITGTTLTIGGTGAMPDFSSFFYNEPGGAPWNNLRSNITTIIIEEGVESIGEHAFGDFRSLTSIVFPGSVTSIGKSAFLQSRNLESITIPGTVTSIGYFAFGYGSKLTSIDVEAENPSYASDGGVLFNKDKTTLLQYPGGKSGHYDIPGSVARIEMSAFERCSGLTSVSIPGSVTEIGSDAFGDCSSLTDVTAGWTTPLPIDAFIFSNKLPQGTSLPSITLHVPYGTKALYEAADVWKDFGAIVETAPSGTLGDLTWSLADSTLTISGTGAMPDYDNPYQIPWMDFSESIASVIIGEGVTSIGKYAFGTCTNLTSVTIPGSVTSIGQDAFYDCISLTSINMPNSVISIGKWAFLDCTNLASITIPASVTSIGEYAFGYCSHLTDVTVGWATPFSIVSNAFNGVPLATDTLHVPAGTKALYEAADVWKDFGTIVETAPSGTLGDLTWSLADSTLTISGTGAMPDYDSPSQTPWMDFSESIASVIIGEGVTSIGKYAFGTCTNLTSVTIPGSVTSIGEAAFGRCESLASITIPASVTSIGRAAFGGCDSLTSITVEADNPSYSSDGGVLFNKDKTTLLQYPGGKTGSYDIPGSVTSIGNGAFSGCSSLTAVTISGSVTSIGDQAFSGCNNLTSITIPGSVISIGYQAFSSCNNLTSITIPGSVTSIGERPFAWCMNLTSIIVEAGNPSYSSEGGVLFNKDKTTLLQYPGGKTGSYIIPGSVTSIGNGAFCYCYGLTAITIPSGVTSIGDAAFVFCSNLTAVTIPGSVTSIGYQAFYGCNSLTAIAIPGNVTSIGEYAFYYCSHLTDVTVGWATPFSIVSNAFNGVPLATDTLHVPAGTKALYKAAPVWQEFGTIREAGIAQLTASPETLSFTAEGGTATFTLTATNTDWTIADATDAWYTLIPSGPRDTVITYLNDTVTVNIVSVSVPANSSTAPRTALITINGTEGLSPTVSLTQEGAEAPEEPEEPEEPEVILPESVSLSKSSLSLRTGETWQLTETVLPADAENKEVNWTSADPQIATVADGLVTAVAPGTTTIMVETAEGGYTATCTVTVEEQTVVVETPQPEGNTGIIQVLLSLPTEETFSASFVLTLPQGFRLDQSATTLADELAGDYQLSITLQTENSWLFEISLKATRSLRAATAYRHLLDIVYTTDESVSSGGYEAKLTDVELQLSDGSLIREDEIEVTLRVGGTTGLLPAADSFRVYYREGVLTIHTPVAEQIAVYSVNGSLLHKAQKGAGEALYPIGHLPKGVLIVRGSSGWTKKIVK